ncbi:hypothetical protein D3C78_1144060 [compost metagenome]
MRVGRVIAVFRRHAHAPLSRRIDPDLLIAFRVVVRIVDHEGRARHGGRRSHFRPDLGVRRALRFLAGQVRVVVGAVGIVGNDGQLGSAPRRVHQVLARVLDGNFGALEAERVVPHDLMPVLGDGEGNAAEGAFDAVALHFPRQLGRGGVLERVLEHPVRILHRSVGWIHINAEARILLQQRLHAMRQLVGMLRHVRRRDRQDGLFVLERVRPFAAFGVEARRGLGQPARVFRDLAVGARRLDGAESGQWAAQLFGLVGRHRRMGGAQLQGQGRSEGRFES